MYKSITSKDISVVVQGPISNDMTGLCIESIRKLLPESEIILSTWKGEKDSCFDLVDQLVLNDDPGGFDVFNREFSHINNTNRQIVSTLNGLKKASRKYAIKIRTDFILTGLGFLSYYELFQKKNKKGSLLREKILTCELYTRNPRIECIGLRRALHPSDIFQFGLTEDLLDIWSIPLVKHEDMIYFAKKNTDEFVEDIVRFDNEQHQWVQFLKKHNVEGLPEDKFDITRDIIELTELTFASNLIILSNEQIGIEAIKVGVYRESVYPENCFSFRDWKRLYKWFCERNILGYIIYRFSITYMNVESQIGKLIHNKIISPIWKKINYEPFKQCIRPFYYGHKQKKHDKKIRQHLGTADINYFCEKVSSENISVVVQGPVTEATKRCLVSIRKYLPKSEIVLSTYEGSHLDGLDYDVVVLSEDPGANGIIRKWPFKEAHNVNRILLTSYKGICAARRRYCLKVRSDIELVSAAFLDIYNKYAHNLSEDSIVFRRIMVEGLCTSKSLAFSIGDWWCLGLTSDLRKMFDTPYYEKERVPFFLKKDNMQLRPYMGDFVCRYTPEQYIGYSFYKRCEKKIKRGQFVFHNGYDNSDEALKQYHDFLANNFLCVEFPISGIRLPKALNINNRTAYYYNYSLQSWLELCAKENTISVSMRDDNGLKKIVDYDAQYKKGQKYNDIFNYASVINNYASPKKKTNERSCRIVTDAEITFVVCGKTNSEGEFTVRRCLSSVKRFYPRAGIILCLIKGEDSVDSDLRAMCNEVIEISRPKNEEKSYIFLSGEKYNSLNLQSYMLNIGLQRVKTRYAARLRTDCCFYNDSFLAYYNKWNCVMRRYSEDYRLFKERILAFDCYTYDTRKLGGRYSYALSDIFIFGLTKDLINLWDGHKEHWKTFNYFKDKNNEKLYNPDGFAHQYIAEEYFLLNTIKKAKLRTRKPKWYCDNNEDYVWQTEKIYASNIVVGDGNQLGITSKYDNESRDRLLNIERLLEIYLINIDPEDEDILDYFKDKYCLNNVEKPVRTKKLDNEIVLVHVIKRIYLGIKNTAHFILPSYRAAIINRKRNEERWQEEDDRYNILMDELKVLNDRLDEISECVLKEK